MKATYLFMGRSRRHALLSNARLYESGLSSDEIEGRQIERFNSVWKYARENLAFYQQWQLRFNLPAAITSLADLDSFPVLTKAELNADSDLVFAESSRSVVYTTGGSTSEPTIFPRGAVDGAALYADNYVGRLWWGISPLDRKVLVWGHSHLFGAGLGSYFRRLNRGGRDLLTRTKRVNGYLTQPDEVLEQAMTISSSRASYVVGYSSALVRIATVVDARADDLSFPKLKGVIATADTLTASDAELLGRIFRCPVIVEYGAAETGVIAASRGETWDLQVLWGSHVVRESPEHGTLVTTLNTRQFPLINYQLGDSLSPKVQTTSGSIVRVARVDGRQNDLVNIRTTAGERRNVWAVHLTQMIKAFGGVIAVQYAQLENGEAVIYANLADVRRADELQRFLAETLHMDMPDVEVGAISWVFNQPQETTRSGKHRVMRSSA